MTDQHKAAMALGRTEEGRAVRDYLEALRSNKPKRGRKRTADSISKRLDGDRRRADEADRARRAAAGAGAPRPAGRARNDERRRSTISARGRRSSRSPRVQRAPGHLVRHVARRRRRGRVLKRAGIGRTGLTLDPAVGSIASSASNTPPTLRERAVEIERVVERRCVERRLDVGIALEQRPEVDAARPMPAWHCVCTIR